MTTGIAVFAKITHDSPIRDEALYELVAKLEGIFAEEVERKAQRETGESRDPLRGRREQILAKKQAKSEVQKTLF